MSTGGHSFCFDRDATTSCDPDADFNVAGMAFAIRDGFEQQERLEIALDALRELQQMDPKSQRRWQSACYLQKLEPSGAQMPIFAFVRDRLDNGVIRIIEHEGKLTMSLPNADLWDAHGLDWLNDYQQCCIQNRENPKPWRGPCCGCTPAEASHQKQ